jgi:protein-tyrosine phosphatase
MAKVRRAEGETQVALSGHARRTAGGGSGFAAARRPPRLYSAPMRTLLTKPLKFFRPDRADLDVVRPSGVLFLCTGNVCRSPMAEALMKGLLARRAPETRVESAGLGAPEGQPADPYAVELMSERGIDITGHRARQVTAKLISEFPIVIVMDDAQRRLVNQRYRGAGERTHRLGRWSNFDVPDPIGKDRLAFEHALVLIDQGVADWIARLWPAPE